MLIPIAMWGSITLLTFGAIQWDNPTQWYQPYRFDPYSDVWQAEFTSMVEADNGDILLAGTTNHLRGDLACMRVDSRGNIIWNKTYPLFWYQYARDLIRLEANRYLLIGEIELYHNSRAWLYCIDGQGNFVWNKTVGEPGMTSAYAGVTCPDGGAFIVGRISVANVSGYNFWGIRIDSAGNILWNTSILENRGIYVKDVIQCHDGSFVVAGTSYVSQSTLSHIFAARINSTGAILWNQTFGEDYSGAYAVTQGSDDSLLLAGEGPYIYATLINLNLDGTFNWNRTILDSYCISSLVPLPNGCLCIGGGYASHSTSTLWVGHVDLNGNLLWSWEVGDDNPSYAHYQGLESQTSGFLLLSGFSRSNLLVRTSNPPRNDTLLYYVGCGAFLILLIILIIVTSILIRYHSNKKKTPISRNRSPIAPLSYTVGLYGYTLFSWLYLTLYPLFHYSAPVYPNFERYFRSPIYLGFIQFPINWSYGDVIFFGLTAVPPIILGMLTFAILQSALFYLETKSENYRPSSNRQRGTSKFIILDILFVIFFALLMGLFLPWLILPFFMGILLVGFYPKYFLMCRWTPRESTQ